MKLFAVKGERLEGGGRRNTIKNIKHIISQLEVGIFLLMPKKKGDFFKDL